METDNRSNIKQITLCNLVGMIGVGCVIVIMCLMMEYFRKVSYVPSDCLRVNGSENENYSTII